MADQREQLGALWRRETRDHAEFLTGKVTIDGITHDLVIFRNGYKDKSTKPDYIIYRGQPREGGHGRTDE